MTETTQKAERGIEIGIDLGTTNTVMMYRGATAATAILSRENEDSTPSVVSLHKGQLIVGRHAVDHARFAPEDTVYSIKRLMGKSYGDFEVQRVKDKVLYAIKKPGDGSEGDVRVVIGGMEYSPIDISAMILKKIKDDAEYRLNQKVTHAVITVPAYFTERQKEATRQAGWQAGFVVKDILDEPSAAAIAYGVDNLVPEEMKTILVYDLGGGTFDASILMIAGGIFSQLNLEGDMWLGGDDFDNTLVDFALDAIRGEYGFDVREKLKNESDAKKRSTYLRFMIELKQACEKAKKQLSGMANTEIIVGGGLVDDDGNLIDVRIDISRAQFEAMIRPQVDKTIDIVRRAVQTANLTLDQIDNVLLVGGSTYIPCVQTAVQNLFGSEKIMRNINPMLCVAQGAGILAPKIQTFRCPKCHTENIVTAASCDECGLVFSGFEVPAPVPVVDPEPGGDIDVIRVTSQDFGIENVDESFSVIIKKNTPYPTEVEETFFPSADNLRMITIPIYQGDSARSTLARDHDLQAIGYIHLPPGVSKNIPVKVKLALDRFGILKRAEVEVPGLGLVSKMEIGRGRGKWNENIDKQLNTFEERLQAERREGKITAAEMEAVRRKIDAIHEAMNRNSEQEATRATQNLQSEIEHLGKKDENQQLKDRSDGLCWWTEAVIDNYEWFLESSEVSRLRGCVSDLRSAVARGDPADIQRKFEVLDKATDNLSGVIFIFMRARQVEIRLRNSDPATSDRIRHLRLSAEDAAKKNDIDQAKRHLDDLVDLLRSIPGERETIPDIGMEKGKLRRGTIPKGSI